MCLNFHDQKTLLTLLDLTLQESKLVLSRFGLQIPGSIVFSHEIIFISNPSSLTSSQKHAFKKNSKTANTVSKSQWPTLISFTHFSSTCPHYVSKRIPTWLLELNFDSQFENTCLSNSWYFSLKGQIYHFLTENTYAYVLLKSSAQESTLDFEIKCQSQICLFKFCSQVSNQTLEIQCPRVKLDSWNLVPKHQTLPWNSVAESNFTLEIYSSRVKSESWRLWSSNNSDIS